MAAPLPTCLLDGTLMPLEQARISPLDRSFLFADGIYEVICVRNNRMPRLDAHMRRLRRSLAAIHMSNPHSDEQWAGLLRDLVTGNGGGTLYIYLQVSRGADTGRSHAPIPVALAPTVFAFCTPLSLPDAALLQRGLHCVTAPDSRWSRCDIKSVALLANVLHRQQSIDAGCDETILIRDGYLTEASASSVMVVRNGTLVAPPQTNFILPSTTRELIETLADAHGIARQVRPIPVEELWQADEVLLGAATRGAMPVTRIDDRAVGNGSPGPIWRQIYQWHETYWNG